MRHQSWGLLLSLIVLNVSSKAISQVNADPSLGTVVTPNGATFEIRGGTTVGDRNLFHSFSRFDVPDNATADFLNSPSIVNIFSRVTGGNASEINGLIKARGTTNFFLMNPNGILFGRNAQLDIGGSFIVTTANAMQFPGRAEFTINSSVSNQNSLLSVDPSAFLFSQLPIGQIINNSNASTGGTSPLGFPISGLRVPNGQNILLVGGDISLNGGRLNALEGRIELGGLATIGVIGLAKASNAFILNFPFGRELSNITLTNDARIATRGTRGGNIVLNANRFIATDGGRVVAGTEGTGNGGDVTITANELHLSGVGSSRLSSGIYNQVFEDASGNSGNIVINAALINILSGAGIFNTVQPDSIGNAGDIIINSSNVNVSGTDPSGFSSGITTLVQENSQGNAGTITINAKTLNLSSSGSIINAVQLEGVGNAGKTNISVDSLFLTADGNIRTGTFGNGRGGDIAITTNRLLATDGGQIVSSSGNQGQPGKFGAGGNILVRANEVIEINNAETASRQGRSGIFAETASANRAGDITIVTKKLSILNGGAIASGAVFGGSLGGNGGELAIEASESINLVGREANEPNRPSFLGTEGQINFQALPEFGIETSALSNSGDLKITTGQLTVRDGASISSSSLSAGKAGDIIVQVRKGLELENRGAIVSIVTADATGKSGNIEISSDILSLSNDAEISARNEGKGIAGNVVVRTGRDINLRSSQIRTNAAENGGGNITVNSSNGNILLRQRSAVRTDLASGQGSGGNITLAANAIVALENSDILAFAPEGKGGNITFNTRAFLSSPLYQFTPVAIDRDALNALAFNGQADVNASGAVSGTIVGVPNITFLQNSLTQLPQNAIDTNTLLANSCITRRNRTGSSFYVIGSGNLSATPNDAPISSYSTGIVQSIPATSASNRPWQKGDAIVEPQGVYQLPNGKLVLSRDCK